MVDPCTTFNIVTNKDLLTDVRKIRGCTISGGSTRSEEEAMYEGTLTLQIRNQKDEVSTVTLRNVKVIKNFDVNLIRAQELSEMGLRPDFETNQLVDKKDGSVRGKMELDQFKIPVLQNVTVMKNGKTCLHSTKTVADAMAEHVRLGHIGTERMEKALDSKISEEQKKLVRKCEICKLANLKRKTPQRTEAKQSRTPGTVISFDTDEMTRESLEGFKYRLDAITNDGGWVEVHGMVNKNDHLDFMKRTINSFKDVVKEVRVDGAKELNSLKLRDYVEDEMKAKLTPTLRYIHEQAGKVERCHQTIDGMVRAMLQQAHLPDNFWYIASEAAAYIHNRIPTSGNPGYESPYECVNKVKPDLNRLKPFGCLCYYHHLKDLDRHKLDARGKKAIFLGYIREGKGYTVLDLETYVIEQVHDAEFIEDDFPARNANVYEILENYDRYHADQWSPEDDADSEFDNDDNDDEDEDSDAEGLLQELDVQNGNEEDEEPANELQPDEEPANELQPDEENEEEIEQEIVLEAPRRSGRKVKPPKRFPGILTDESKALMTRNIMNYQQAMKSQDAGAYKECIVDYLSDLMEMGAIEVVARNPTWNVIGTRWVCCEKLDGFQTFLKYKVRLTPLGYMQKKGVDFNEVFAPVSMNTSTRLIHVIGQQWGRKAKSCDVVNAFQRTRLTQKTDQGCVYAELPEGMEMVIPNISRKDYVIRMLNAINGMKQSGREFYDKLSRVLKKLGFRISIKDKCLFQLFDAKGEMILIVCVHVDDCEYVGKTDEIEKEFEDKLNAEIPVEGKQIVTEHLSVNIIHKGDDLYLTQQGKIDKYCEKFQVTKPMTRLVIDPKSFDKSDPMEDKKKYYELIGSLNYLTSSSRPDLQAAFSILASQSHNPTKAAWQAGTRVLAYLLGTKHYGLKYAKPKKNDGKLKIELYCDSSHKSPHEPESSRSKSRGGHLLFVNGSLISWQSKLQNLVAQSSEEAEIIAMNDGVRMLKWLVDLLKECKIPFHKPFVYSDNSNCIRWVVEQGTSMRNIHYDVKLNLLRKEYEDNMFDAKFVCSEDNCADMMTKLIGSNLRKKFTHEVGLMDFGGTEE